MNPDRNIVFPNPRHTSPEGLLAVGGDLSPSTLIQAYSKGIFPWPQEGYPMLWFCPDPRGILDFHEFRINRSARRALESNDWQVSFDRASREVINNCRLQKRPNQNGTWILPEMESAYCELANLGKVLTIEIWLRDQLVGGIYGVLSDRYFSAESMFYKVSGASKVAFIFLVQRLKDMGHQWMDIQMLTDVSQSFGGKYVDREEFLNRIGI